MTTGPDTTPASQPSEPAPGQQWAPPAGPAVPPQGWAPPAGPPQQGWTPGPSLPQAPAPRSRPRWLRAAVPVAIALVVGGLRVSGVWGGADEPKVGDCVHETGSQGTSFDVVDCSSKDANYKVAGIDPRTMTSKEFAAAREGTVCTDVPETTYVMWQGAEPDEGTVYCAAPVGAAG